MSNGFDDVEFGDHFSGVLDGLSEQMDGEFKGATADLKQNADQIIAQLNEIKDMQGKAGTDQANLVAKTQDVKDDLAAFERRFGSAGQKIGQMIRSKVNAFLPIPL